MADINWESERRRLAGLYAKMEESELEKLAIEGKSLTDVAREVLLSEISRRGMSTVVQARPQRAGAIDEDERERSGPPVMIRRYQGLSEALLSKSILESAGIESFLADENLIRIDWFYSNLVGGIKLLVRGEDAEEAIKVLEQSTPEAFQVEGVGEYQQPQCPKCRSLDVAFDELNKRVAYGGVLFAGAQSPATSDHWKCHACGHEWAGDADVPLG